eukprot:3182086-Rhodomonas_salina.1
MMRASTPPPPRQARASECEDAGRRAFAFGGHAPERESLAQPLPRSCRCLDVQRPANKTPAANGSPLARDSRLYQ